VFVAFRQFFQTLSRRFEDIARRFKIIQNLHLKKIFFAGQKCFPHTFGLGFIGFGIISLRITKRAVIHIIAGFQAWKLADKIIEKIRPNL